MAVTPTQFRIPPAELEILDALAVAWGGPVRPLTRTDVIRALIRRAGEQELADRPKRGSRAAAK